MVGRLVGAVRAAQWAVRPHTDQRRETSQREGTPQLSVVIDHVITLGTITDVVVRAPVPHRGHAHRPGPRDVGPPQVTDVGGRARTHAEVPEGVLEDRWSGLVPPHLVRERPSVEAAEEAEALKDAAQAHMDLEGRKTTGSTILLP